MTMLVFIRYLAFGFFVFCGITALGSWAVRTRRISAFSAPGRTIRKYTDSVLAPIERLVIQRGGNPQNAGWWLVVISVVGGIVVVTLTDWVVVQAAELASAGAQGPREILRLVVYYAVQAVSLALVARVIGSWFGIDRFNRWMRPAYTLTDWIVEPLRKIVPTMGMIDITPLVAWAILQLLVLRILRDIL